jgi:tetratricopeptide (TPR) repeat protein
MVRLKPDSTYPMVRLKPDSTDPEARKPDSTSDSTSVESGFSRTTSREDLQRTATAARSRLAQSPADTAAAISLADVLLRLARVESDAGHALEAERVLKQALRHDAGDYTALKMLGAVYLSQHRFGDAITAAGRARAAKPEDAWNYGVLGDAHLEMGDYDRAFEAFDTMARLRPDAAAYARVAYAHEIQGRLEEALATMRMAAEATSAHDAESQAWHAAQLGHLSLELGDLDGAQREYMRAAFIFPGHPYARIGLARVASARGEYGRALETYRDLLQQTPTPELAAAIGDLLSITGDGAGARTMYAQAETLEREGWKSEEPQPAALARMLAERGLATAEAVSLAERAAARRSDIFTSDALAMAYFRAGRLDDAAAAAKRALRTGTRNRHIVLHAAGIAHARGDEEEARRLLARLPDGPVADPLLAVASARLSDALAGKLPAARRVEDNTSEAPPRTGKHVAPVSASPRS